MMATQEVDEFNPLHDFVLIKPIPPGKTAGGIQLLEGSDVEPPKGHVVKVGPGVYSSDGNLIPMPVQKGQTILIAFVNDTQGQVKLDGEKYWLVRSRELIATWGK